MFTTLHWVEQTPLIIINRGGATPYLGPYLATHARPLGKGLPGLPGLPGALPGLSGTLPGLPGPYLAYLALTWRSSTASYLALPGPPSETWAVKESV